MQNGTSGAWTFLNALGEVSIIIFKGLTIVTSSQSFKKVYDTRFLYARDFTRYLPTNKAQYSYTSITSSDEIFIKLVKNIVDPFRII